MIAPIGYLRRHTPPILPAHLGGSAVLPKRKIQNNQGRLQQPDRLKMAVRAAEGAGPAHPRKASSRAGIRRPFDKGRERAWTAQ